MTATGAADAAYRAFGDGSGSVVIDLSLDRMHTLLDRLGRPHERLPPVVHVAGTNGKGSTIAFMRAMAEAAGLRVHAYTSPHWFSVCECVTLATAPGVSGQVAPQALADALARVAAVTGDTPPTPFEALTLAAFILFAAVPADLLLLETGMGGTLDATNLVDRPAASVITPISHDHTAFLGSDIAAIAAAKAGIIKPGVPAFSAAQTPIVAAVLADTARAGNAPLAVAGQQWTATRTGDGMAYVWGDNTALPLPLPALAGAHQIDNAGLAIATLRSVFPSQIDGQAIAQGLRNARWPGRLQQLDSHQPGNRWPGLTVWVDGAHNDSGGQALAVWAAEQPPTSRPLTLVVGMLADKDVSAFLAPLAPHVGTLWAVPLRHAPRPAHAPETIAAAARRLGVARVSVAASVADALQNIEQETKPGAVVICGSLSIVPEAVPAQTLVAP